MWAGTPMASPPSARRCSSVSLHASALRLATTTFAPARHVALGERAADAAGAPCDDHHAAAHVEQALSSFCGSTDVLLVRVAQI